jgi:hypothetical protein
MILKNGLKTSFLAVPFYISGNVLGREYRDDEKEFGA